EARIPGIHQARPVRGPPGHRLRPGLRPRKPGEADAVHGPRPDDGRRRGRGPAAVAAAAAPGGGWGGARRGARDTGASTEPTAGARILAPDRTADAGGVRPGEGAARAP